MSKLLILLCALTYPITVVWASSPKCGGSTNILCPTGTPCENDAVCTENSECDEESKVCQCKRGYRETSYKFCLADYLTDCSVYACNEESQLVCNTSRNECECALLGTHFSVPQGKCVANEGTDCSKTFGCTDNAFCNSEHDWKCYCSGGFSATSSGRCLLGFDRVCNNSFSEGDDEAYLYACNSDAFFRCNEKCVCENEKDMVYDTDLEECVSLVGGKCDAKVTINYTKVLKCVDGSECIVNGTEGICKCRKGRQLDDKTRTCSKGATINTYIESITFFLFISYIVLTWTS